LIHFYKRLDIEEGNMVKIFVGNLSHDVSSADLGELFIQYGEIETCEKLDHKQFGFVHMVDEKAAKDAVTKLNRSLFKGKYITVEISSKKPQKLFVGNIDFKTTQDDLRKHFEAAGANVVQVENCEGKKFGFVRIEVNRGYGELNKLVKNMDGSYLRGNRINVELSEDKTLEEKRRLRREKEMGGYEQSSWGQQDSYHPYPSPQGWGSSRNTFNDFSVDSWAPSQQAMHVNKIRGFGSGDGGYNRGYQDYEETYSEEARSSSKVAGGQHEEDPVAAAEVLQSKLRSQMFSNAGLSNLELLQTGELSDYRLECDGTVAQVHKIILAAKSPVFRRIIKLEPIKRVVRDVDSFTLRMLLHFIYTGTVELRDINPDTIMKLVSAANIYQVDFLKEGLQASMATNITEDTAVDYLIYSDELQLLDLKKVVNKFICSKAKVMKGRTDFKTKLSQHPHLIIDLFSAAV